MDPIVVLIGGSFGIAGLVAARLGRRRMSLGPLFNAAAAGVLVGVLVGAVPRLIGSATVVLAQLTPALQPAEVRSVAASIGPLIIQNLAAALVIGFYIGGLRWQRGERRTAPLFALALGIYGLADGLAGAASSLPFTQVQVGGLALGYLARGFALSGAFATRTDGFGWLATVAVLGGLLHGLGTSLAHQLGFEQVNAIGAPALAGSVALLVVSLSTILGSNVRQLPVTGFLAGLGLTLVAARLQG